MKSFSTFITESIIVYRGVTSKYDHNYKQPIIWVSTSKEHSDMYSQGLTGKGQVKKFKITKTLEPLDLQFINSDVDVPYIEIRQRLKDAMLELYEKNKITEKKILELFDVLNKLTPSGTIPVWQWMEKKEILTVIKQAGFNCILQREGMKRYAGNIITYGLLDKSLLSNPIPD